MAYHGLRAVQYTNSAADLGHGIHHSGLLGRSSHDDGRGVPPGLRAVSRGSQPWPAWPAGPGPPARLPAWPARPAADEALDATLCWRLPS